MVKSPNLPVSPLSYKGITNRELTFTCDDRLISRHLYSLLAPLRRLDRRPVSRSRGSTTVINTLS